MTTPLELYQQDIASGVIQPDAAQQMVVNHLQRGYEGLVKGWEAKPLRRLLNQRKKYAFLHGIYLWGGVGVGKTYLMDLFFHSLPSPRKLRMHFHHFMQFIVNTL